MPVGPPPIRVVPYEPNWRALYEEEAAAVAAALAGEAVALEHVGSTAVPGMCAKPVIDILVGLLAEFPSDGALAALRELGYRQRHRSGGRLYLRKGIPRSHFVHVTQWRSRDWQRIVAFRELLRAEPSAAARYAQLKLELCAGDRGRYAEAKSHLIDELVGADRPPAAGPAPA